MTNTEDIADDEALARALQEEFDKELVHRQEPRLPPGTVIFTNVVPGPSVPPNRKRGTHSQGFLRGGLAGYVNADPEIQRFLAEEADAESEEYEDEVYEQENEDADEIDCHLTTKQKLDRHISATPKADRPQKHSSPESGSGQSDESEEQPEASSRKGKNLATMLETMEQHRKDRADHIRITFIRNTNVKDRKTKFISPPKSLVDLLKIGLS